MKSRATAPKARPAIRLDRSGHWTGVSLTDIYPASQLRASGAQLCPDCRCLPKRATHVADGEGADQLMCEHPWGKSAGEEALPRCACCDLGWADYVQGSVRALTRMGAWD